MTVFLPEDIKDSNKWREDAGELHKHLKTQTPLFNKEKQEQLNALNEFICTQFVFEKPPYPITSWLSDELIYSNLQIDLILYPSVITGSHFCNFAIHPNFVDKYLTLEKVIQVGIQELGEQIKYSFGLFGVPDRMNIKWEKPTEEQENEFSNIINAGIKK